MLKKILGSILVLNATISLVASELPHNLLFDFFRVLRLITGIVLVLPDEITGSKKKCSG